MSKERRKRWKEGGSEGRRTDRQYGGCRLYIRTYHQTLDSEWLNILDNEPVLGVVHLHSNTNKRDK